MFLKKEWFNIKCQLIFVYNKAEKKYLTLYSGFSYYLFLAVQFCSWNLHNVVKSSIFKEVCT